MAHAVTLDAHQPDVAPGPGLGLESEAGRDASEITVADSPDAAPDAAITAASTLDPPPSEHPFDLKARHHDVMANLSKRDGRTPGRRMDEEAIAGTAVGVILAFALLVCCLYPVVVHYVKKHRRSKRMSFECEYGFRGQPSVLQRRLSSSDSLKNGDSSSSKERGFSGQDPYAAYAQGQQARQPPAGVAPTATHDGSAPDAIELVAAQNHDYYSSFPFYYQDVVPASAGPQQIVLKGTSEDYYSPHIPSEAFGMLPMSESDMSNIPTQPGRSMSKGSSLRYNVRSLFRRRGMDDHAIALPVPYTDQPPPNQQPQLPLPPPQDPSQVQQFYYAHETSQAPTEFAPMAMDFYHAGFPAHHGLDPMGGMSHGMPQQINGDPSDPSTAFALGFPNPATVNPMDIMPASTESEMWHRTDFQLFSTAYDDSPDGQSSSTEMGPMTASGSALPPPPSVHDALPVSAQVYQPLTPVPSSMIPQPEMPRLDEGLYTQDVKPVRPPPPPSSLPSMSAPPRPPVPSLPPPPVPGLSSTNPSTISSSTPSAHDSPSPDSLNSSDYGHSASPHDVTSVPSPRGGVYSCEEPGCNQVFDQPHKLK